MEKGPVSSSLLEERVAMYLQAIEYATASSDNSRRQDLEKDIQSLMDLMEQVNMGQTVSADRVPPPLHLHSHAGEPLANPLGELSARLADYHKALYYADIEIGETRTQQIQTLQRGLQVIHKLQGKAQAGHPIRAEDIPPPVTIPTDDEFVADPKSVITERIPLFYQAIEMARQEGNKTRVTTLEEGIQKLHYLLQRAETKIPVYKKDLPCPPALGQKFRKQTEEYRRTVELLTKMSGLSARAAKLAGARGDVEMQAQLRTNAKALMEVLHDYEMGKPLDMSTCPYSLADIERLADQAGVPATQHIQDTETLRLRINQYKLSALKAKRTGHTDLALQHMRVVKGLQPLVHAAENGEMVDMTQVPPPPSEQTPTTEEQARVLTESAVPATQTQTSEVEADGVGKSLAEELSAFLEEMPSPERQAQDGGPSRPAVTKFAELPPSLLTPFADQQKLNPVQKGLSVGPGSPPVSVVHTVPTHSPQTLALNGDAQNGVVVQNSFHRESLGRGPAAVPPGVPQQVQRQTTPPAQLGKNTSPKYMGQSGVPGSPALQAGDRGKVSPGQMNGFLGGSPHRQTSSQEGQVVKDSVLDRSKSEVPVLLQDVRKASTLTNGTSQNSSGMTCIEILKYERMILIREGSDDAKVASDRLSHQMEEEKQRLRSGGYEAWLAYLGQVEEDVSNINNSMKQAREEGGQDHAMASLIIKKELAERELALMRKRLPELQM